MVKTQACSCTVRCRLNCRTCQFGEQYVISTWFLSRNQRFNLQEVRSPKTTPKRWACHEAACWLMNCPILLPLETDASYLLCSTGEHSLRQCLSNQRRFSTKPMPSHRIRYDFTNVAPIRSCLRKHSWSHQTPSHPARCLAVQLNQLVTNLCHPVMIPKNVMVIPKDQSRRTCATIRWILLSGYHSQW